MSTDNPPAEPAPREQLDAAIADLVNAFEILEERRTASALSSANAIAAKQAADEAARLENEARVDTLTAADAVRATIDRLARDPAAGMT